MVESSVADDVLCFILLDKAWLMTHRRVCAILCCSLTIEFVFTNIRFQLKSHQKYRALELNSLSKKDGLRKVARSYSSKKKGLSIEEKKQRMLELFFEKKEFFQMKELEKIGPKEKGVVCQSVKDVVQMLVDDALVDSDKIGTMVCYWAFPSKALQSRKRKLEELRFQIGETEKKKLFLEQKMKECQIGKEDTSERRSLADQVSTFEKSLSQIDSELQEFQEFDPENLKKQKTEADTAKDAANRWTDNVFAIKQWCKNKFQIEETTLDKQFSIPEDFDYVN